MNYMNVTAKILVQNSALSLSSFKEPSSFKAKIKRIWGRTWSCECHKKQNYKESAELVLHLSTKQLSKCKYLWCCTHIAIFYIFDIEILLKSVIWNVSSLKILPRLKPATTLLTIWTTTSWKNCLYVHRALITHSSAMFLHKIIFSLVETHYKKSIKMPLWFHCHDFLGNPKIGVV